MLATAMATGSPARGAAVLFAFGLGTLPNLLAVGFWLSRFRTIVRSRRARMAAGLAVCLFGVYGLVLFGQALVTGTDPHAHHHHAGTGPHPGAHASLNRRGCDGGCLSGRPVRGVRSRA
jgi:sulfite exporter TauE/SafE